MSRDLIRGLADGIPNNGRRWEFQKRERNLRFINFGACPRAVSPGKLKG
jgi:hypothetical protein